MPYYHGYSTYSFIPIIIFVIIIIFFGLVVCIGQMLGDSQSNRHSRVSPRDTWVPDIKKRSPSRIWEPSHHLVDVLVCSCGKWNGPEQTTCWNCKSHLSAISRDTIPPLLVLEAEVVAVSSKGERVIPLKSFFTGPGQNVLKDDEVILKVRFPLPTKGSGGHIKLGLRRGTSCSVASVAVWVVADKNKVQDIRIALGGVAPTPIRAGKSEDAFKGQSLDWDRIAELSETVMEEIRPITDVRGSAEYRKKVSASLLAKAVRQAVGMEE